MPQRPMQTHTQRQAWEGHSANAPPPPTSASAKACPSASGWTGPSVATPRPSGTGWGGEWIRMPRGLLALAWEGAVSPALLTRGWGVGESGRPELLELCCLETELGWPGCN